MRLERDEIRMTIVLVVLAFVFVFAMYMPHRKRLAALDQQCSELQKQLQADGNNTRPLVALVDDVDELKSSLSGAQQYVPPQSELAELLKQLSTDLERVGSQAGPVAAVRAQETQTQAIASFANYSILPVEMRFQTTFASAFEFLRQIEAMPRLVRVDVLELSWKNESSEKDKRSFHDVPLDVRLTLSAFFSPSADLPALTK